MTIMLAIVLEVRRGSLLVRDLATGQNVVVNTNNARRFQRGDRIGIWYNGIMTNSLPPQISATRIVRLFAPADSCCR